MGKISQHTRRQDQVRFPAARGRTRIMIRAAIFLLITVNLVFIRPDLIAQSMSGLTVGNYAGINGARLNPASLHDSKTYLEIQLAGIGAFVQNNYLFLSKSDYRFSNFFKSGYQWPSHREEYGVEERVLYWYDNARHKNLYFQAVIDGPGAMVVAGKHALALTSSFRAVSSMSHIPDDIANFAYLGLYYPPQHYRRYKDYGPIRASAMAWGEVGLTYSYLFHVRGFDRWSAGITLKRLWGISGAYINIKQVEYMVPDDSTVDVRNITASFGMALPVDYGTNDLQTSPLFKGHGFSGDLGITYTRLIRYHQEQSFDPLCSQSFEDYLFRVGVALIDIGGVRYNTNAVRMKIENKGALWENVNDLTFVSLDRFLDTLSYKFYGDTHSAYDGDAFTLYLPSALSVQFDYHVRPGVYVNASLIQGFPLGKGAMIRPSELSLAPRYESRWFSATMPVSLYNWQKPRIGLAFRIYGLTIGTDKLGGFFHLSDFTGLDFYASLKISFARGSCGGKFPQHCGEPKERYRKK